MICRACGKVLKIEEHPVLNLSLRDALPKKLNVPFYRCKKCGNLSSADSLKEEFHIERYKNNHSWMFDNEETKKRFLGKREVKQNKLNKKISKYIVKSLPAHKFKFLEIGCAEGLLISKLQKATNWDIKGIEIDTVRANWGKEKGRPIINSPYELQSFEKDAWDIIAIHEALDHFNSIPEVLGNIRFHLTDNGYLTVLNTIFRWTEEQKRNKFHHSTYFTHEGILKMFSINGFKIIKIFNIPVPKAGRRFWRGHKWHWSKHLFIAQKMQGKTTDNSFYGQWYWNGKRYKAKKNAIT